MPVGAAELVVDETAATEELAEMAFMELEGAAVDAGAAADDAAAFVDEGAGVDVTAGGVTDGEPDCVGAITTTRSIDLMRPATPWIHEMKLEDRDGLPIADSIC